MAVNTDYYMTESNNVTAKTAIKGKSADQLDMNDFFNLFVAQMTNQDMMNPQDNTEFVAQMAQFTSLQGIKQIQEYQLSSYAVSYAGKDVSIAHINEITGDLESYTGVVESVTFYDGAPQVVVNGKKYPLHEIMEVNGSGSSSGGGSSSLNEAAGYIGKTVRILHENDTGAPDVVEGKVTSVTLFDGKPYVIVDDNQYPVSEIQSIVDAEYQAALKKAEQYLNKYVQVDTVDDEGNKTTITGKVTKVKVVDNEPYVFIEDGGWLHVDNIKQ